MHLDVLFECYSFVLQKLVHLLSMISADCYHECFLFVVLLLVLGFVLILVLDLVLLLDSAVAIERLLPEPQDLRVVELIRNARHRRSELPGLELLDIDVNDVIEVVVELLDV